jgi:Protein of unknown function (DUF2950)
MASLYGEMGRHVHAWRSARRIILLFALLATTPMAMAAPGGQKGYASPREAVAALVNAVKSSNQVELSVILGSSGSKLISSGDAVADKHGRATFVKAYSEANKLVFDGDAKATLVIGKDDWPFPIPLVKSGNTWKFDTKQGEQEILNRRIGRNELAAIQVCLAIVDAEREYAASHLGSDGVPRYASRIVSTPNKRDGLYWPTKPSEPLSPLGPLVADAASEGYTPGRSMVLAPYHGYFYRILIAQGKDAPGGKYEYFIKGKMIGGFAAIAYPARYGASGIETFIVNHDGVVFEKDLGQDTAAVAPRISAYNPDSTWKQVDLSAEK